MRSSTDTGGPWPEPDDNRLEADADRPGNETSELATWDEHPGPSGSRGVSLVVAGLGVGFLLVLPALIVIGVYTFITVYAIVKAVGSGSDAASPTVVLVGLLGLVTLFVLMLALGTWAIGRTADPKRRRR